MFFIIYLLKKYENHVDIIRQILTAAVNCLTINIHSFAQCERVLLPTNITKYELPRYGGGARMLPLLVHGVPRLRGARPSGLPAKHGMNITIMSISIMSLSKYRQHEHIIALPVSALTWGRLGSSWRDGDPRSDRIAHHISPGETLLQHLAISLSFDFPLITFYSPALLQNAGVFRELGGASLAGKLVHHADTRDAGLGLLQQLVVAGGILPFV